MFLIILHKSRNLIYIFDYLTYLLILFWSHNQLSLRLSFLISLILESYELKLRECFRKI